MRQLALTLALVLAPSALFADETVIPLFDGKSLDGWVTPDGKPITKGWHVVDGVLHLDRSKGRGGHIVTTKEYGDGELTFEWKVAKGGNSGVKYRVKWYPVGKGKQILGCEYQLLDDPNHGNGRNPKTSVGALYGLFAPAKDKPSKPAGEWNVSRVIVNGNHIEHWLNGAKILDVDIASEEWKSEISKSKFRARKDFAENSEGLILLQDHGNEVWFRKIELRPLGK